MVVEAFERRPAVFCPACRVHWYADEPPTCQDTSHGPQPFEMHEHRSAVTLQDSSVVVAVSFDQRAPYERDQPPAFGLYLDRCWQPPWPHEHLEWPDFGLPTDTTELVSALQGLLVRARLGHRVELGCQGGHGRTGTALACAALLTGLPASDAVGWVRATYCEAAIETPQQEAFVASFGIRGSPYTTP